MNAKMKNTKTIDYFDPRIDNQPAVGLMGYLVSFYDSNHNSTRLVLRDHPPKTNRSLEYRVHGDCGSYNNVSTTGEGIGRVIKVFYNGRVKIEFLTHPSKDHDFALVDEADRDAVREFLENTGFDEEFNF